MKKYNVGDKIKFAEHKRPFTIKACNDRWLICTKPFNPKKTFIYTIVDLLNNLRGPDNYYCKFDYDNIEQANLALIELDTPISEDSYSRAPYTQHELEISGKRRIALNITN